MSSLVQRWMCHTCICVFTCLQMPLTTQNASCKTSASYKYKTYHTCKDADTSSNNNVHTQFELFLRSTRMTLVTFHISGHRYPLPCWWCVYIYKCYTQSCNLHIYIYIYIYRYICTCVYRYRYVYAYVCIYVYIYIYIERERDVCTHTYTPTLVVCVCGHICKYIYIYIYIHIKR